MKNVKKKMKREYIKEKTKRLVKCEKNENKINTKQT
jgi:hypothetical protein